MPREMKLAERRLKSVKATFEILPTSPKRPIMTTVIQLDVNGPAVEEQSAYVSAGLARMAWSRGVTSFDPIRTCVTSGGARRVW